jgi:hypothetical protein
LLYRKSQEQNEQRAAALTLAYLQVPSFSTTALPIQQQSMRIEPKMPTGYYVYTISVADVVRYIGKGKGLRLYCHMKEVRSRLNRDYRLQNIGSRLQQNLTKAVLSGAKVIEQVLMDNLTETAAYKLEYDKLREYVFAGKRDQLWNVIPASIQTPQELQAFTERLQRNLNSRDRWIRYFSERTLATLIGMNSPMIRGGSGTPSLRTGRSDRAWSALA